MSIFTDYTCNKCLHIFFQGIWLHPFLRKYTTKINSTWSHLTDINIKCVHLCTYKTNRRCCFVTGTIIGTCPTNPRNGTSLQECHYVAPNDQDIIINRDHENLGGRGTLTARSYIATATCCAEPLIVSRYSIKTRIRAKYP